MKRKIFTLLGAILFLTSMEASATDYYVIQNGTGTGLGGWSNGANISTILAPGTTLATGTHVYIMQGSYNINTAGYVYLDRNDILIQGGFSSGSTGTDLSQYNPANNTTKILVLQNMFSATSAAGTTNAIEIKGITFDGTGGNGIIYGVGGSSAGSGALKFTDLIVTNFNNGNAKFAFNNSGTATFTNCYCNNNMANSGSSVILNNAAGMPLFINHCSFINNGASLGVSYGGGAISSYADVTITNSSFCGNRSSSGGALSSPSSSLVYWNISNSTFSNNYATGGEGGALSHSYGRIKITNSNFYNNKGTYGGGAISAVNHTGPDSVVNCVFYNNQTLTNPGQYAGGGAIDFSMPPSTAAHDYVANSKFIGNGVPNTSSGTGGGAISFTNTNLSTVKLESCLFYKNTVGGDYTVAGSDLGVAAYWSGSTYSYNPANNCTMQLPAATYTTEAAPPAFMGTTTYTNNATTGSTATGGVDTSSFATYSCLTSTQILPVSLTVFTASLQGSIVKLVWATATETNNKGFAVERSSDGINFTQIAFVNSLANNGNSSSLLNYIATDASPLAGTNYYRLKQVDFDGYPAYSNITTVLVGASKNLSLSVYPNPVSSSSKVIISGVANFSSAYVTVVNGIGQAVQKIPVMQSVVGIDFNSLPHGIYHLLYTDAAGNQLQTKVVK